MRWSDSSPSEAPRSCATTPAFRRSTSRLVPAGAAGEVASCANRPPPCYASSIRTPHRATRHRLARATRYLDPTAANRSHRWCEVDSRWCGVSRLLVRGLTLVVRGRLTLVRGLTLVGA